MPFLKSLKSYHYRILIFFFFLHFTLDHMSHRLRTLRSFSSFISQGRILCEQKYCKMCVTYCMLLLLDSEPGGQMDGHLQKAQWAPGHFLIFPSALLCEPGRIHKWMVLPLFWDRGVSEQSECLHVDQKKKKKSNISPKKRVQMLTPDHCAWIIKFLVLYGFTDSLSQHLSSTNYIPGC